MGMRVVIGGYHTHADHSSAQISCAEPKYSDMVYAVISYDDILMHFPHSQWKEGHGVLVDEQLHMQILISQLSLLKYRVMKDKSVFSMAYSLQHIIQSIHIA